MIINHKSPTKKQRYNTLRDSRIASGFTWKGVQFQTDERSQQLIASRALKLVKRQLLNEECPPFVWIASDNSKYTFTAEEFLAFAEGVDKHVESIFLESHLAKHA